MNSSTKKQIDLAIADGIIHEKLSGCGSNFIIVMKAASFNRRIHNGYKTSRFLDQIDDYVIVSHPNDWETSNWVKMPTSLNYAAIIIVGCDGWLHKGHKMLLEETEPALARLLCREQIRKLTKTDK